MSNKYPKLRKKNSCDNWLFMTLGDVTREYKVSNKYVHHQNLLSLSYGKIIKKDIEAKKGLLPASFDTYQIIKEGIIVFRVTDLQNDKKSLRVGISSQEGIITPAYVCVECTTDEISPMYLFTLLHYYDSITKVMYNMGNGLRQTLSYSDLKGLIIPIPPLSEQHFITDIFFHIDSIISEETSRLASLKQVKEASLQAMFPQKGETVPKIRFKGFEGEWEEVKLSSFAKRIKRRNSCMESTLALTIASALGLVSQNDYFNNSVVGANIRNYYLLKRGEFAYNKSYSNGYPFGSVKRLDRYEQGILSTLYIVFTIDDSISSDYLTHFFDTTLWHKDVAERAAEGARNHGLLNISAEDFLDIAIWKPRSIEEQQHVASYLTSLDKQIALQTQRLEKLRQIKAACLDKMFV
jgi:sau1hsdS1